MTSRAAVARWRRLTVVGIDTEFIRTRTFFPIAALYQIATDEELAIVDPLRVSRMGRIQSAARRHVDREGDARVFRRPRSVRASHRTPRRANLFDTQVASAFLST